MLESVINVVVGDNLDLGCTVIERAATDKVGMAWRADLCLLACLGLWHEATVAVVSHPQGGHGLEEEGGVGILLRMACERVCWQLAGWMSCDKVSVSRHLIGQDSSSPMTHQACCLCMLVSDHAEV